MGKSRTPASEIVRVTLPKASRLRLEDVLAKPNIFLQPADASAVVAAETGAAGSAAVASTLSENELRLRFEEQQRSAAWQKMLPARAVLPATAAREAVLEAAGDSAVTIISGGTGCGKSTQVPQFLLDELLRAGDARTVVCTQPRRIAAVGVAERVAEERGSAVGRDSVGYRIRGESKFCSTTKLTFCTVGLLLKMLEGDPSLARERVATLIIDEVHERSLDADLLLLHCRKLLATGVHCPFKLVLMSATLDTDALSRYFGERGVGTRVVAIEGRTFPVQRFYLSDAIEHCGYACSMGGAFARADVSRNALAKLTGSGASAQRLGGGADGGGAAVELAAREARGEVLTAGEKVRLSNLTARAKKQSAAERNSTKGLHTLGGRMHTWMDAVGQSGMAAASERLRACSRRTLDTLRLLDQSSTPENVGLIVALVRTIVEERRRSAGSGGREDGGAVLVFMPGVAEISRLLEAFASDATLGDARRVLALPLHSQLSTAEQKRVFRRAPSAACTKVVVATNIAEASITIDDVTTVVDCGTHKETSFDPHTGVAALVQARVSLANAAQRAGRAGRVRPGECYHLYMEREAEHMPAQQPPAMLRSPLEGFCLRALALGCGSLRAVLAEAPAPPEESAVSHVLRVLVGLGAVEGASDGEALTPLGRVLARLPLDLRLGRLLLLGAAFRCLEPTLVIAAALSYRSVFATAAFDQRDAAKRAKVSFDSLSDHLAELKAVLAWRRGGRDAAYARSHFLSQQTLCLVEQGAEGLRAELGRAGVVQRSVNYDVNSENFALVKALLAGALYPSLATAHAADTRRGPDAKRGAARLVEFRTVRPFGRRGVRKPDGTLVEVRAHPHHKSVLCGSSRLAASVARPKAAPRFLAYYGQLKTSRVFMSECTLVSALQLLLFAGGTLSVKRDATDAAGGDGDGAGEAVLRRLACGGGGAGGGSVTLCLDSWIEFATTSKQAGVLLELRARLQGVLRCQLEGGPADAAAGRDAAELVDAVAALMLSDGDGADDARPLPAGWTQHEDAVSSTGRCYYKNVFTGKTQWERPTRAAAKPATAAPRSSSKPAPKPPPTKAELAAAVKREAEAKARVEAESVERAKRDAAAAAARAKADAAEAAKLKSVSMQLAARSEAAAARERQKGLLQHISVSALLAKLELKHYAEAFAEAEIDDEALAEVIDVVNEDAKEGAEEVEVLIARASVRGGAAVKLRRALTNDKAADKKGGGDAGGKKKKQKAAKGAGARSSEKAKKAPTAKKKKDKKFDLDAAMNPTAKKKKTKKTPRC